MMKRKDMIELIHDAMRDNHFGQYGQFMKMAESILNTIEDNGMLPPLLYRGTQTEPEDIFGWDEE